MHLHPLNADDLYYEVAVDAPLDTTLTYGQPQGRERVIAVGCCVLVPLGARKITGYVLGRVKPPASGSSDFVIKPIAAVLTEEPFFPASLLPFYRWIARYYHHPIGEVVRTALPLAPGRKSGRRVVLTEQGRVDLTSAFIADAGKHFTHWLDPLVDNGCLEAVMTGRLWRQAGDRNFLRKLEQQQLITIEPVLLTKGGRVKTRTVLLPGPELRPLLQDQGSESDATLVTDLCRAAEPPLKKSEIRALGLFVELFLASRGQAVARTAMTRKYPGCGPPLKQLVQRNILATTMERVHRDPFAVTPEIQPVPEQLTDEQEQVLSQFLPAITAASFAPFLLFGVTGCGKTEVYLRAVEHALNQGRTALVLVPEIALAAQLEAHFHSRFGSRLAVLHSGLSDGERLDQWQAVLEAKAAVVLGARSAVFAPLDNLGVIIVDEEHEPAYKQEDGLRYHGRDLAVLRGRMAGCPVLLGSATPSVVSYHHCLHNKYSLLTMAKRVAEQPLPVVEIIDLANTKRSRPDLVFSDQLIAAIHETLAQKRQSLLFVNRRGFSSFMLCRECGHILQCRHCQVSLTLHRSRNRLLCHYCGYSLPLQTLCPSCGSMKITGLGIGSERIEEEVRQLFPEARTARLDSDTSSNRKQYLALLAAVRSRQIDILVGTQMIAKGLHFPHITLVGVVWADSGLGMPDYKAAERTFSLLSQVTGRAGRGDDPGRVIIQTHQPHHYAIQQSRDHNYDAFYQQEIAVRSPLGYPPFSRLINIRFSGVDEEQVQKAAANVAAFLRETGEGGAVEILGPSPSPLVKLRDLTRWQLLLKSRFPAAMHALCAALQAEKSRLCSSAVTMGVDVDPENMM
ncbi:replication restart helicase PriA [Desulfobulbus alkaliphilus]|uniref:replication restart helicase PriA n=1 Tax=Desulfobulbus alkaliphilus TaxID=869814 RepID=UPI001965EC32|nr:primosomal protein N' [Desulfobulbus alkaliphilus]MBM9537146.1 primosomal protein N' [Desulfobulbus alkaliphilus]